MRLKITTPGRTFDYSPRDGMSAIVIGNRQLDDVCIADDPKVSGPHVRLERMGEAWSFTDQFSDSGTVHNGNKTYNGDLKAGDVLTVGDTEVRVLELVSSGEAPVPQFEPKFDTAVASPAAPAEVAADPLFDAFVLDFRAKFDRDPPNEVADKIRMMVGKLRGTMSEESIREKILPVILHAAETPKVTPAQEGSVFVQRVTGRLLAQFKAEHGVDASSDAQALKRVQEAAAKAVAELENERSTEVSLPFLMADAAGPKHLSARIVRKHLHETDAPVFQAGTSQPVQQQHDAPAPVAAAAKPNNKPGVAIAVAIIMVVLVVGSITWALEDSAEMEQDVQRIIAEAEAQQKEEDRKEQEQENNERKLTQQVLALLEDRESPPQDLMDMLDEYEAQARAQGFSTGWDYERTRTWLESRAYNDVAQRSNDAGLEVYNLQEKDKFRDAAKVAGDFQNWLLSSRHNTRAREILELDESIERWKSNNESGSEELLATHLLEIAEALTRDDFALATEAVKPVIDGAILDDTAISDLQAELRDYQHKAAQQVLGEIPAARKAFDRKKDKLPDAPANRLLKAGDYTGRTRLTSLRYDATESIRNGEWDGRQLSVWGLKAEVKGDPSTTYIPLVFTRAIGSRSISFTASEQFTNHAPAIQLAVFELATNDAVEDRMALLVFAFDHGLMDDAGRIAVKVREAAPDKLADLDEILSAKWKVPVPEGGFLERDGRVVPE